MNLPVSKQRYEIKKCILVCKNCHGEIHQGLHPDILIIILSTRKNTQCVRKQERVNYLGGKCRNCGYNKCLRVLEFHHRNPKTKLFGFHKNKSISLKKIIPELNKCELLCSNCHAEEHDKLFNSF